MRVSKALMAACVVLLGVAWGQARMLGSEPTHRTILTFGGPVTLPGTSLPPGTYVFEVADPDAGAEAVIVMNHARSRVYYMGMTKRVRRPPSLPKDTVVTFGEVPAGTPVPITGWYPLGEVWGHRFIYTTR